MRKRTALERKVKVGMTFSPEVVKRLDTFCGQYSRSGIVEGIVASFLDMAEEEGIPSYAMLCTSFAANL